ncbi:MAG: hypothetical protein HQK55_19095 [Deltaproteobacteria bacterium]|nr:hypothetical protein [Deltaproteobacteria bacterium]MBF0550838.1 hypothetical protein [Deltaproteobacteria bacterium]
MGILTLKYSDDSMVTLIKGFLATLPPHAVEIVPELSEEWDHIPYASDEEQAEIEELLKNPDCHVYPLKVSVTIE